MKILYDHQFFPVLRFSGITRYFYEIISRLSTKKDVAISLFMGWNNNEFGFRGLKKNLQHFFCQKRYPFPYSQRIFNILNRSTLNLFAKYSQAEIYHQTYYQYLLPEFKGKRVITVYDMNYFVHPEFYTSNDPVREWTKKSVENAAGIIAISQSAKNDLVDILKVPENKVSVIYLANSLIMDAGAANPVSSPYILYVGQRFKHKNFIFLLTAYALSKRINSHYRLVCFGGSEITPQEADLLTRYSIQDKMQVVSGPDTLLATYYKYASLLVYPSIFEGFGMPVIEAMHYGCPVLSSNKTSLPEVGGDAAEYFDPKNQDELIAQMEKCLFDETIRKEMSSKGLAQESKFSWDKCADETYDFYRAVSGKN